MISKPKFRKNQSSRFKQKGASFILFALLGLLLIGVGGLGVDVGNLVVARQELRNAADAGALAGARCLYNDGKSVPDCLDTGTVGHVNVNANRIAYDAARANTARKNPQTGAPALVEVNQYNTNIHDVQRGHWSWGRGTETNSMPRGFTANSSTNPTSLQNKTSAELDDAPDFINAIKVTTRRQSIKIPAFLSSALNIQPFEHSVSAVAWIGFSKNLLPGDVDQPLAICKDKILSNNEYQCNVGRVIPENIETAAWTNFEPAPRQPTEDDNSCPGAGAGSANDLKNLIKQGGSSSGACSPGNPNPIFFGDFVSLNNGATAGWGFFYDCWDQYTENADGSMNVRSWPITIPVIDCTVGFENCRPIVGAANVEVLWIQDSPPNSSPDHLANEHTCAEVAELNEAQRKRSAPCIMDDWPENADPPLPADSKDSARWDSFVNHFGIVLPNGESATVARDGWSSGSIYLKPSCSLFEPAGDSGGENFGVLSKIPRLVE